MRGSVIAADNPAIFLSKFLVSSSLLWQILNSLMYRVRLGKFLVWQPFILAATFPTEIDTCRYVAAARPDLTATVFGALQEWGRVVLAGSMGLGRPFSSENTHAIDPYTSCFHVHAFLIVMGGYVVPSLVIWTLDKHAWHSFLAQDPRSLRWKEGPNERELQEGMAELRRENKAGEGTSEPDWRSAIVLFIAAACVWQALDMMIH